jgi:hypothetical protein
VFSSVHLKKKFLGLFALQTDDFHESYVVVEGISLKFGHLPGICINSLGESAILKLISLLVNFIILCDYQFASNF